MTGPASTPPRDNPLGAFRPIVALNLLSAFRHVNANLLFTLVRGARDVTFEPGEAAVPPGDLDPETVYFLLVLEGELGVLPVEGGDLGHTANLITLVSGECFGELAFLEGKPMSRQLRALRRARVLFFMREDFDEYYSRSTAFRRAMEQGLGAMTLSGAPGIITPTTPPSAELVVVRSFAGSPTPPTDAYAYLLARAVAEQFGTRSLALDFATAPTSTSQGPQPVGATPLDRLTIPPGSLQQALLGHAITYDYIFLMPGEEGSAAWREVASLADRATIVKLWRDLPPTAPATGDGPAVLDTVLLEPGRPRAGRRRPWFRPKLVEGRAVDDSTPRLECRLPVDHEALARAWGAGGEAGVESLYRTSRPEFFRWARVLTGRTVGVALGGGGAWGYAHVALIRELHRRKIPVDVLTGASFGSMVGAYYATLGLDGLDLLVRRGPLLHKVTLSSLLTTRPMEELVAHDVRHVTLERTPLLFHPFATNLTTGRGVPLIRGPVGLAVRASGSAPGVFGPTVLPGLGRYVDGCVVNNVPTVVLYARSAALRIAANIYPRPNPRPARDLGPFTSLAQFNLWGRALDMGASGSLMLHVEGVRQSITAQATYEAPAAPWGTPLLGASEFERAEDIVAWAEQDERLQAVVDEAQGIWVGMRARGSS